MNRRLRLVCVYLAETIEQMDNAKSIKKWLSHMGWVEEWQLKKCSHLTQPRIARCGNMVAKMGVCFVSSVPGREIQKSP